MPKGTLKLESPEKLDSFGDSLFTCYAYANDMPLPSDLKLKLTSHQTDHLAELSSSDAVELQLGKISATKLSHQEAICWLRKELFCPYGLHLQVPIISIGKIFFLPTVSKISIGKNFVVRSDYFEICYKIYMQCG